MSANAARLFREAVRIARTEGVAQLAGRIKRRILGTGGVHGGVILNDRVDVLAFYDFVIERGERPARNCLRDVARNTMIWFIPDFGIGSGGHLNIFRYIHALERRGYKCTICLVGAHRHATPAAARRLIRDNFFPVESKVVFSAEDADPAFFGVATGWTTAYALRDHDGVAEKLYFVQDFEPWFYPRGSEYDFAEQTYTFGFVGLCSGGWLSRKLAADYGMRCYTLSFSYDRLLYHQSHRREPDVRRVFCYVRPPTPRRGLETALLAMNIVGERLPHVEFIFAGWDIGNYHFPHKHLNAGVLSLAELPDLYSQCDVSVVISYSNLSLLPLEIMSCGCAVVLNRGENNEWLFDESVCAFSGSSPNAIAETVIDLIEHDGKREALAMRAKTFAAGTSWDNEYSKLLAALDEVAACKER